MSIFIILIHNILLWKYLLLWSYFILFFLLLSLLSSASICDSFHVCQPCSRFQPIHAAPALPPRALNPSPRTTASPGPWFQPRSQPKPAPSSQPAVPSTCASSAVIPGPRDSRPESSANPPAVVSSLAAQLLGRNSSPQSQPAPSQMWAVGQLQATQILAVILTHNPSSLTG